jgi:lipopolysaccharide export system permease protein
MKIIHRSILKELSFTFIISLACLNFILMMEKLLRLTRFLSGVGTSMTDMAKLILFIQPQLFLLTIPMSLLLSTLLVYGRLNVDNELVILRSSGMDFRGISRPVVVLGFICFLLNIAVSFYIGPRSSVALREEITNIIRVRTPLAIEEGRFNTYFKNTLIIVKEKVSDNELRGIFIYDSKNKQEPRVVMARRERSLSRRG